ncbi:hypothetical protein E2C01_072765 [Portunus trituberculatus]|uniref:Uncharacterized protein n=1 Tax=Portunus trituberculatus TaxID=210409 RepID=A0A5B7I0X5_PORTR|nr:hypothetical protein [Portunus trituberculatus]
MSSSRSLPSPPHECC